MDINTIQQMISSLGFPVCMVVYFIWDKYKTMQPMIDAVQNNTLVLNRLLTKIDHEELLGGGKDEK